MLTKLQQWRSDPNLAPPLTCPPGADQYKYGKNRVEADAKRLQAKDDELGRRKQEIRCRLTQLKKERLDLRTALEAASGEGEGEGDQGRLWVEVEAGGSQGRLEVEVLIGLTWPS